MTDKFQDIDGFEQEPDPGDKGKKKKQPAAPPPVTLDSLDTVDEGLTGRQQEYRYDEFDRKFFGDTQRFQPKLGADNARLRAGDQSGWEQAGLFLGNLIPNIAGNLVENIGYLGSLASEWGDDRDYNNALTELGKGMRNPAGEIFRERPNEVWDPSDPAWWYNSAESLVVSATAFAATGIGMAKALSWIPQAVRALGGGATLIKGAKGLQQLSTAAGLAYTEGAMSGSRVFDRTYELQFQVLKDQGLDDTAADSKARHLASQAAAATVQLNTIVNTGLNLTAIAPLFKDVDDIKAWYRTNSKPRQGETYNAWTERIKNLSVADPDVKRLLNPRNMALASMGGEAGQEGFEEMVNQWAENRGMERGAKGQTLKGLGDLLSDAEHFFNDTMNEEGALNFVLGAVGGVTQTALIDNIPVNKVYTDEQGNITDRRFDAADESTGKYQTKLVSSRYRNAIGGRSYFNNIKDTIVKDINRIQELSDDLDKAVAKKNPLEIERAKMRMFDAGALNAVTLGIGDAFSLQYKQIADLNNTDSLHEAFIPELEQLDEQIAQTTDPTELTTLKQEKASLEAEMQSMVGVTEAMQKGYAKDMKDNAYKAKANKAVEDIKYYEDLWKKLDKKYRTGDEWDGHYADYLFNKEVEAKRKGDIIRFAEAALAEAELGRVLSLSPDEDQLVGPIVSDLIADNDAKTKLLNDAKAINRAWMDLNSTDETKQAAGANVLKEVASTYLPNAESEDDLQEATAEVAKDIKKQVDTIDVRNNKRIEDLQASPGYTEWSAKNTKKGITDYLKDYRQRKAEDMAIEKDKSELAIFKAETEISNSKLAKLKTLKGRKEYLTKAKATRNKLIQSIKEKTEKDNANSIARLFDPVKAKDLDDVQRQQYAESLLRERESIVEQINKLSVVESQVSNELKTIQDKGLVSRAVNGLRFVQLRKQRSNVRSRITLLQNKISQIDIRIEALTNSNIATKNIVPVVTPVIKPTTTLQNFLSTVEEQAKNEIAALPQLEEDLAIYAAEQIMWELLEDERNPVTELPPANQAEYKAAITTFVKPVLAEYNKILEEQEEEDPLQELVDIISSVKFGAKKQAELLTSLAELWRQLEEGIKQDKEPKTAIVQTWLRREGFVGKGKLSSKKAGEIEEVFNHIYDINTTPVVPVVPPAPIVEKPETPITSKDIPEEFPEDSNEGQPLGTDIKTFTSTELDVLAHGGLKVIDGAKINTLTHEYEQDIEKDEAGNYYYVNKSYFFLNDAVNPLYLEPGKITGGSKVKLVVDTEWLGSVNSTEAFTYGSPVQINDSIFKYMDGDKALSMKDELVGNLPIKIVDVESGTILGYVPRVDWIKAKYPNVTNDYRNVVDVLYDEEGNIITDNNVQEQADRILLLRKKIAIAYNNGKTEGLDSSVISRRRGHALRTIPTKASEALPDTSLKLALLGKEAIKTGAQETVEAETPPPYITSSKGAYKKRNIPGVLLPDASGKLNFEPLWTNKLGKAEVDTTVRAIEIYLTLGNPNVTQEAKETAEDHAKFIEESTGFDLSTHDGLKGFINQYYFYTKGYNEQEMTANAKALDGDPRTPEFKLAIAESIGAGFSKALIKAGVTFLNQSVKAVVNEDGKINESFARLLHDQSVGLQSKFRNVVFPRLDKSLRGINSPNAITELVYQPNSNTFRKIEYSSYNDMVKQNSMTTIYGKLKLPSGSYVYYANPTTNFDYNATMAQEVLVSRKAQPTAANVTETAPEIETDLDKVFDPARQAYLDNLETNLDDEVHSSKPVEVNDTKLETIVEETLNTHNVEELKEDLGVTTVEEVKAIVKEEVKNVISGKKSSRTLTDRVKDFIHSILKAFMTFGIFVNMTLATSVYTFDNNTPSRTPTRTSTVIVGESKTVFDNYEQLSPIGKQVYDNEIKNGEAFIIVDKPSARVYVFDNIGNRIADFPAILGAAKGEGINRSDLASSLPGEGATTPADRFALRKTNSASGYDGRALVLKNTNGIAIHQTYTGELKKRTDALDSETIDDNRMSWGCINVSAKMWDQFIKPNITENSIIVITPDNQPVDSTSTPKVETIVQSAGNVPGAPISLATLTELRNFTPAENRNSLSPAEAMEQLKSLGLTTLPEGYNPFFSC